MSAHTPGPWTASIPTEAEHPGYADGTRDIDVWDAAGKYVADIGGSPECQEANARLIAAAPELLAALRAAPLLPSLVHLPDNEARKARILEWASLYFDWIDGPRARALLKTEARP